MEWARWKTRVRGGYGCGEGWEGEEERERGEGMVGSLGRMKRSGKGDEEEEEEVVLCVGGGRALEQWPSQRMSQSVP